MMESVSANGVLGFATLYGFLRWVLFPHLVRTYPSLCHGSERERNPEEEYSKLKIEWRRERVTSHASAVLSMRLMSTVMAIAVSALGVHVVWSTSGDILWSRSQVLIPAGRFLAGYFIVDIYAMYQVSKWTYSTTDTTVTARLYRLVMSRALFIIHHLFFVLAGPIILSSDYRGGRGDYLVGVVCLFELSTPFLSLHYIQRQIGSEDTVCYQLNGVLFLLVYFIFRILSLPFVYIVYAWQHHQGSLWRAVISMRLICHTVVFLGFVLMSYWFVGGLWKFVHKARKIYKYQQ